MCEEREVEEPPVAGLTELQGFVRSHIYTFVCAFLLFRVDFGLYSWSLARFVMFALKWFTL